MVAVLSLMNPLGTMVGFVLPYAFVDTGAVVEVQRNQFRTFMVSQAAFAAGLLLLVLALMQGKKRQDSHSSSTATSSKPSVAATMLGSQVTQEK